MTCQPGGSQVGDRSHVVGDVATPPVDYLGDQWST